MFCDQKPLIELITHVKRNPLPLSHMLQEGNMSHGIQPVAKSIIPAHETALNEQEKQLSQIFIL
jgi:hypothetical protein